MHDLWQEISDIASKLHPDRIEVLAKQISSLSGVDELEQTRNSFGPGVSEDIIDKLEAAWGKSPTTLPIEVASALRGASATSSYLQRNESIEMVWTGPSSDLIASRHTEQVLLEVIASSKKKLFIVSFVAYDINSVRRALRDAAERDVRIDILLESSKRHGGKVDMDSTKAFSKNVPSANIYTWSTDASSEGRWNGAVHAKCAVADGTLAFITSANLTTAAMERNMELGVLVRGGTLPEKLHEHLDALITTKVIEPIDRDLDKI
ncbi:MAG: phospholipase [Planctomycetes bacterium]|nr:phospholipase [Planctomycetota bacterium]